MLTDIHVSLGNGSLSIIPCSITEAKQLLIMRTTTGGASGSYMTGFITLLAGVIAKYCDVYVCVCMCLSVY